MKNKMMYKWNRWSKLASLPSTPPKKGISMKAYVLYNETEDIVTLKKAEIKDGNIEIGNNAFDVDKFRPKTLKTRFGYHPLYMLKWDCVNPPEDFNPTFKPDKDISPEVYRKTMKMKVLGNMLKIEPKRNIWLMVGIGIAFGIFVAYYLFAMGVIKI